MVRSSFVNRVTVTLVCLAVLLPQSTLLAQQLHQKPMENRATKPPLIADVAMTADRALLGQIVNAHGAGVDGAMVVVSQGNKEVARTVADREGKFVVRNLDGGMYNVTANRNSRFYRVWSAATAPPVARDKVMMVADQNVLRGQGIGPNMGTAAALGLGAAGVILGIIGISQASDAEDEVEDLKHRVHDLESGS